LEISIILATTPESGSAAARPTFFILFPVYAMSGRATTQNSQQCSHIYSQHRGGRTVRPVLC
jgi:hypothetical protein